jgi:hypothetical protein
MLSPAPAGSTGVSCCSYHEHTHYFTAYRVTISTMRMALSILAWSCRTHLALLGWVDRSADATILDRE